MVWVNDLSPHLPLRIVLVLDAFVELACEEVRVLACLGQGFFLGEVVVFGVDGRVGGYLDTDEVEGFSVRVLDSQWLANIREMVRTWNGTYRLFFGECVGVHAKVVELAV